MKEFTNIYVKKENKKKILPLIIGIIFLIVAAVTWYLREEVVNEKLKSTKDMHETILMEDNTEKSSYVTINYYPYGFADYSDDEDNAYYIVADEKYFYIAYMNKNEVKKYTKEKLKAGIKLNGTTANVPYDVKKLAVEAYNKWYSDVEDFKPIYIAQFDDLFGSIYLDTTKTKYALTTEYNGIYIVSLLVGICLSIYGLYITISYRRRLSKLTTEEKMLLDAEMNSSNAKFYNKADIYLTNKYLIDFHKFNYFDYKDIKWIYTHIQRTNGVKSNESLVIVLKDGKTHFIASTSGSKKMKPIYDEIYETVTTKNPNIRIGYTDEYIKLNQEEWKNIKEEKKKNKTK